MNMKNKLTWRLKTLPTVDELRILVQDKLITQEEARDILFNSETEEDRDKKSLESEIKFLRDLVEKLSDGKTTRIVEVIKEIKTPYYQYGWYQPYNNWCTAGCVVSTGSAGLSAQSSGVMNLNATYTNTASINNNSASVTVNNSFSSIKTF